LDTLSFFFLKKKLWAHMHRVVIIKSQMGKRIATELLLVHRKIHEIPWNFIILFCHILQLELTLQHTRGPPFCWEATNSDSVKLYHFIFMHN
jgi:hypothetical protein